MTQISIEKLDVLASALRLNRRQAMKLGLDNLAYYISIAELELCDARDARKADFSHNEETSDGNSRVIPFPAR